MVYFLQFFTSWSLNNLEICFKAASIKQKHFLIMPIILKAAGAITKEFRKDTSSHLKGF
jgi:hypothetical protein